MSEVCGEFPIKAQALRVAPPASASRRRSMTPDVANAVSETHFQGVKDRSAVSATTGPQQPVSVIKAAFNAVRGLIGLLMLGVLAVSIALKVYLFFNPPLYNYTDGFGRVHQGSTGQWEYEAWREEHGDDWRYDAGATWSQ
jgi:hypothetical protein